jgi:hypothetical protein
MGVKVARRFAGSPSNEVGSSGWSFTQSCWAFTIAVRNPLEGNRPMKTLRVLAAAIVGGSLVQVPAQAAAAIERPFAAGAGDGCGYGSTDGTLTWRYGVPTSPLPLTAVDIKGVVTDRPVAGDPGFLCRDDGYYSRASFTAYASNTVVATKEVAANNAGVDFAFTFAPSTNARQITRIVVRVCRDPLVTLPPSYCGKPVEYPAPPIAAP